MERKCVEERFWEKVQIGNNNECWIWTAGKTSKGYGGFWLDGKTVPAHCVAWELNNGPIENGLCVLHKCDVRACVNPNHLFLGSRGDNNTDRKEKGRNDPRHGARNPQAKLTRNDVHEIRRRADSGEAHRLIAKDFNVKPGTISDIARRHNWGWLKEKCDTLQVDTRRLTLQERAILTNAQAEVIDLMCEGYGPRDIAKKLGVTDVAIYARIRSAKKRIGNHSVFEMGSNGKYLVCWQQKQSRELNDD